MLPCSVFPRLAAVHIARPLIAQFTNCWDREFAAGQQRLQCSRKQSKSLLRKCLDCFKCHDLLSPTSLHCDDCRSISIFVNKACTSWATIILSRRILLDVVALIPTCMIWIRLCLGLGNLAASELNVDVLAPSQDAKSNFHARARELGQSALSQLTALRSL